MTAGWDAVPRLLQVLRMYHLPTYLHSRRVALMVRLVGADLGWSGDALRTLCRAALLHDVGKIAVPVEVLDKPGLLTAEEWGAIYMHPRIGANLVRRVVQAPTVAAWIQAHHERWDGGGYPDGIAGQFTPVEARMLAVIDAFDAMLSGRPYHGVSRTVTMVLEELERGAGSQFDPKLVRQFTSLIHRQRHLLARVYPPSLLRE